MTRRLPANLAAEEALLGACLLRSESVDDGFRIVAPEDFSVPTHQAVAQAIVDLYDRGEPTDVVTVAGLLKSRAIDVPPSRLIELQGAPAAYGATARYARDVAHAAVLRKIIIGLTEVVESAYAHPDDPGTVLDLAHEALAGVRLPEVDPAGLVGLMEFLAAEDGTRAPWVIPGMLRVGWRAIVVAGEGMGKSELLRGLAVATARGVHPFLHTEIPARRTLIVDLENPEDVIRHSAKRLDEMAHPLVGDDGEPVESCWILHRPEGLYLRRRADRAVLEAALEAVRPQLVCLGPLYKAHERQPNESGEDAAEQTLQHLDDLRTRHGFALVMEHHAPLAQGGSPREMRPFGSQRWTAWPEFGISLTKNPETADRLDVKRYRGDRIFKTEATWPIHLDRGLPGRWPFVGRYEEDR